jgi:flagellar assembly factor FliW
MCAVVALVASWKESVSGMEIVTARFGSVEIAPAEVIHFSVGLSGLEDCLDWALLADAQSDGLGWLQCTSRTEIALAVVNPRRFVPGYQLRVTRSQLAPLKLDSSTSAHVLVIVGKNERSITLNLKAPLVINLPRRLGRQVVACGNASVQHELASEHTQRKRIA